MATIALYSSAVAGVIIAAAIASDLAFAAANSFATATDVLVRNSSFTTATIATRVSGEVEAL